MITVLIADDHPIFRQGLKAVIDRMDALQVTGEAEDGRQALDLLIEGPPDLLLLDLSMPQLNGFQVLEQLPDTVRLKVVVMTSFNDRAYLEKALELGASGYLLKDNGLTELTHCIEQVMMGQRYISPSIENKSSVPDDLIEHHCEDLSLLTKSELRVMYHLADFLTSKEIARNMNISYRTVQNHRSNIKQKLNLSGMHQLTRLAQKHKAKIKSILVN